MNYEEAINWCEEHPLKVVESKTKVMYYNCNEDKNKPYECNCFNCYCEHYEPIGIVETLKDITEEDDGIFYIVCEISLKDNSEKNIDIERYNWVKHRGYEKEPHKYVLTTLYPYSGYLYVDDEPICPAWLTEENNLYFNDYGKNALKNRNLIGKSLIIKNISDTITGYKCRYPSIIGKEDEWVIDVGEMRGSSSCAVCLFDPNNRCVKPD